MIDEISWYNFGHFKNIHLDMVNPFGEAYLVHSLVSLFQFWVYLPKLLGLWPWESELFKLPETFLIFKMRLMIANSLNCVVGDKWDTMHRAQQIGSTAVLCHNCRTVPWAGNIWAMFSHCVFFNAVADRRVMHSRGKRMGFLDLIINMQRLLSIVNF